MKLEVFHHEGEGIREVYKNEKWLIAIKNWREANDIESICRLEIHYKTDEQFVLLSGGAALIYAQSDAENAEIMVQKLEPMKVFNVPVGTWFNNVLSRDAKLIYIEDSNTCGAPDNSVYRSLSPAQIAPLREKLRAVLKD